MARLRHRNWFKRTVFLAMAALLWSQFALAGHGECLDLPGTPAALVAAATDTRQQLDRLLAMHERMERAIHAWAALPDSIPTGDDVCALIEAVAAAEGGKFVRSTPRRLIGRRLAQENLP